MKTKCIEVKLLWVFFVFPPSFFALFGCKFIASNLNVLLYICPSQCFLISFHQVIPEEEKEMKGFTVLHIHMYASHIYIYVYMYMSMCITCRSIYQWYYQILFTCLCVDLRWHLISSYLLLLYILVSNFSSRKGKVYSSYLFSNLLNYQKQNWWLLMTMLTQPSIHIAINNMYIYVRLYNYLKWNLCLQQYYCSFYSSSGQHTYGEQKKLEYVLLNYWRTYIRWKEAIYWSIYIRRYSTSKM